MGAEVEMVGVHSVPHLVFHLPNLLILFGSLVEEDWDVLACVEVEMRCGADVVILEL